MSICVFTANPYLQICALFGGTVLLLCIKKKKALKLLALCAVIIAVMGGTNPIFVHRGLTELFHIGKDPYTLEALLYGLSTGCAIAALLIWFSAFNAIVTQDDILAVFGKHLPKTALVISMILAFIPKLRRKYTDLYHCSCGCGETRRKDLRRTSRLFTACMAYEAERVLDISMAMKARGYGLKNRTCAASRHFRAADIGAMAFILALTIVCYVYLGTGKLDYWFYPRLSPNGLCPVPQLCFFILCISPLFFIIKEKLIWRSYPANN
jgi:energy-coupling factor transport system permease protein